MADLCDVETAFVAAINNASLPGAAYPILGNSPVRIYRGHPPTAGLVVDRSAGIVDIAVFAVPDATRNTTRWPVQTAVVNVEAGLSAAVSGQTASFTGVAVANELAGLLVDDTPYIYRAQLGDSSGLVAAILADQVRATQICWLEGSSLTIPGATSLVARTAGVASMLQEWSRQEQDFRLSVWAGSPQARDAICSALHAAMAQIAFLPLSDGSGGRLRYKTTASFDDEQVASVYRRELVFSVEYGTTITFQTPTMLFGDLIYNNLAIFT